MFKKIPLILLIAVMVIQLAIPIFMISYTMHLETNVLEKGTEYKFKVYISSVRNKDGESVVCYNFDKNFFGVPYGQIFEITTDRDGFSQLSAIRSDGNLPENYVIAKNGNLFPYALAYPIKTERTIYFSDVIKGPEEAYITVKVYKGYGKVTGIYADGIPLDDWLKKNYGDFGKEPFDGLLDLDNYEP